MKYPKPFQFKQFCIYQDKTAMKVGTDGVLLGAWCTIDHFPKSILDIGTGTGLIALQLAQRSDAEIIDAVELDENAFEQAVENFERSDWSDRLFCYHSSFNNLAHEFLEDGITYDLIVSNPPFYTDRYESVDDSRNKARFTTSLNFEQLLNGVKKILSEEGVFSVIVPFKEEENFIELAKLRNLNLKRRCKVKGTLESEIKRSLLEFSFKIYEIEEDELTIEIKRHQYTQVYIDLVKDFYLKM